MDCKTCVNYEPKEQKPVQHPGRIFTKDLWVGMIIRRHNVEPLLKLAVILSEPDNVKVKSLQMRAGFKPQKYDLYLARSGLQPFCVSGKWATEAWCEEVK